MIKDTDNKNRGANDRKDSRIKRWLKYIYDWNAFILPVIYLAFLSLYILSDNGETFMLIMKHGYGVFWVISIILIFISCLLIEKFSIYLDREINKTDRYGITYLIASKCGLDIFLSVIALHFFSVVEDVINSKEVGPEHTVISVVSDLEYEGGRNEYYYMSFELGGETKKIEQQRWKWEKYHIGDTIAVTYCFGCLNRIVYNNIEIVRKENTTIKHNNVYNNDF